ncbi:MAG: hypothetical protein N2246_00385 [Candidatus Sumerlaeia bacterium]|nr:hypothetical protein [Candidatus Sumerlaeia bacterium]
MFKLLKREVQLKVSRKLFYLVIVPGLMILVVLIVWLLYRGSEPEAVITPEEITPSQTVKDFYHFLQIGNRDNARMLLTTKFMVARENMPVGSEKQLVAELLQQEAQISEKARIKILDEKITGNYAILKVEFNFIEQNTRIVREIYLYREYNFWYIAGIGAPPPWQRPATLQHQ